MGRTAADQRQRSKQDWERGKGAKKKGNPNYTPCTSVTGRKSYCLRKKRTMSVKDLF